MPVQDDVGIEGVAKDAGIAPSVSETHISDMDSDDLDNVPLARLIKKSVFVPTLDPHFQAHGSNVEPGPSHHSPPVGSSIPNNATTTYLHIDHTLALIDESIATKRRNDVSDDEIPTNDEDVIEPVNTGVHTDEIPVGDNDDPDGHNDSQLET
ncbi:uncharacterized protein E5676_scaffold237G00470 [Cucumis melo var. makuwa]|uniref:Envelope-like protein n=1 Tax=Cucumis melo var. makuwa TaxID=1194695 RepID=A0A5A7T3R7_CUCMM|nr:uncharacterized protein E6C27_scaffold36G003550 [Cucumis melo var. makuwa]TYK20475.1 uncharacterized protein E5676_scaffold237G00470 [Cucumis melo var. makuwa]